MRKVAKKVRKLSLFSQLSAPIKSGVTQYFLKFRYSSAKMFRTYRDVMRILQNILYRAVGYGDIECSEFDPTSFNC